MEANEDRIRYLLTRYTNQAASIDEERELFDLLTRSGNSDAIKHIVFDLMQDEAPERVDPADWEPVLRQIVGVDEYADTHQESPPLPGARSRFTRLLKWTVAASVVAIISLTCYYFLPDQHTGSAPLVGVKKLRTVNSGAILPGRTQATLLLADGSAINLDTVKNGMLTSQGNTDITKSAKGELVYSPGKERPNTTGFNVIQVPRGGRYSIILPDGSRVWLNAASSLKYPVLFHGKVREVVLTGEGYFEVAHNANMPFRVRVDDMSVEVLGTHFNVNAYRDERAISTTLLEGSVKVYSGDSASEKNPPVKLKPGQQANLKDNGRLDINYQANLEQAVAWKDNKFEFNGSTIESIMHQVARWYDVDIVYRGPIPERRLKGKFSRDVNLAQLIEMLRYTGINITIEDRTIKIG